MREKLKIGVRTSVKRICFDLKILACTQKVKRNERMQAHPLPSKNIFRTVDSFSFTPRNGI